MTGLNAKQAQMLEDAMERRRAATQAAQSEHPPPKPRQTVDTSEYVRKLNESIAKDQEIAANLKKTRIDSALREWDTIVGPRFANARVEDQGILRRVNSRVERIVAGGPLHKNSMVLTGHLGVGKTWTGYAYARRLLEEGVLQPSEILHGTEIGLLTSLSLATFDRADKIQEFLKPQHKFYFIDEVGRATFKTSELRHEIWYAIINHAYENHIPVVLTTNKSTSSTAVIDAKSNRQYTTEMEQWIGEAAYDRLKYMTGEDGVVVPGDVNKRGAVNTMLDNLPAPNATSTQRKAPTRSAPRKPPPKDYNPF
ncbi:MAG: ATP-binding protein [Enterococcus sp.]|nr:ATP-binding protein [Enterococcus sp.]